MIAVVGYGASRLTHPTRCRSVTAAGGGRSPRGHVDGLSPMVVACVSVPSVAAITAVATVERAISRPVISAVGAPALRIPLRLIAALGPRLRTRHGKRNSGCEHGDS